LKEHEQQQAVADGSAVRRGNCGDLAGTGGAKIDSNIARRLEFLQAVRRMYEGEVSVKGKIATGL